MWIVNSRWLLTATLALTSLSACNFLGGSPEAPKARLIRSDYAKGELTQACQKAIEETRNRLNAIAAISAKDRTFDNTVLAFETVTADMSDRTTPLTFMGYVSPTPEISAEGSDCEQAVGQFVVDLSTRKDLYDALKGQTPRNAAEKRLYEVTIKSFEDNGLKLAPEQLAKMKELKGQLTKLESQFSTNLNGDATTVELSAEELAGVPADYLSRLKKSDSGKYIVTTRESDYDLLDNASNPETRRKWLLAYYNRQSEANTRLLEQAIALRQQIAKIMGYSTWADYRIQGRMAVDAKTVMVFLNGLKDKLASRAREDVARLLKFKQELDPKAAQVDVWDISYLSNQLQKRDYSLDQEKIREYFPSEVVVAGMFDVYSQLLGVHYVEVKDAKTWFPDVKLYRIENNSDNRLIGFFYTDFNPRQGKYGHAAAFPLISGRMLPGGYTYPVSAIVANLTPPANGKPSLLSHEDVVTIFHEFGHIMHQTLTRAPFATLSGSAVAQDFVEAPSQMLENWPYNAEILKKISGHYLDHSRKLPADLLDRIIAARDFNQGYRYTRQLMLATLDLTFHTAEGSVDTSTVYDDLFRQMMGVEPLAGGHFAAGFGHLMGGYDAGYYGYLWSEVYAADLFTRFDSAGLLNATVGADYRRMILEQGNSKEALDLLREFLGRDPNSNAFFRRLHI